MLNTTHLQFSNPIQMRCGDSTSMDRMVTYLTYSGIDARKAYDEDDDCYALLVDGEDRRRASRLLQTYLQEENERQEEIQRKAEENESAPYSHVYEKCEDRYKNHLSSAITFAIGGTALLAALLLSEAGKLNLPVTYRSNPFSFCILAGTGIFFDVIAGISFHRAGQLKNQIADEEELTAKLINWFITTYDKKQLDDSIMAVEGPIESAEILYLKRLDIITNYLTRENDHLDDSFTSKLADDIYTLIYES